MKLKNDNRGVSEVVGAILVFGVLIALLSIMQTQAVPAANEEVEFNHNQEVQTDLSKLHETTTRVLNTGRTESTSIRFGTTYPTRLLFFNPGNPSGTIRSTESSTATVEAVGGNVQSPNTDVQERIDNIGTAGQVEFDVRALEYEPNYNEYGNAPTTRYEYGVLYNDFGDQQLLSNDRSVVDTRHISLFATAGNFDRSSAGSRAVELEAAPASPTTVPIRHSSPGAGNFTRLTLPTQLAQEQWDEIVAGEDNVVGATVDPSAEEVEINLRSVDGAGNTITYQLEVPRFSVDDSAPDPTATYVTYADSDTKRIAAGRSVEMSAEVRDEYNNPIPDEEVTFELVDQSGTTVATETTTSDGDGRATVEFTTPPVGTNTVLIDATSVSGALGESQITLEVGNPNPVGPVVMMDSSRTNTQVTYTLQNDGSVPAEINDIQLEYAAYGQEELPILGAVGTLTGGETLVDGPSEIQEVEFAGGADTSVGAIEGQQPQPVSVSSQLSPGNQADLVLTLDASSITNGDRLIIGIKVFYAGGHTETHSLALTA